MPATVPEAPPGATWRSLMDVAFQEACLSVKSGEVPVGAALFTATGELLAKAHNQPISSDDPTAHAEILCLREAGRKLGNYRLSGTIMAVTLEPCLMCTGALIHSRVSGVIVGAPDPVAGALFSNLDGHALSFANHTLWYVPGVMESECSALLKRFFLGRRKS